MKLTKEDRLLLKKLSEQHQVSADKIFKLLDTVGEYEFKARRTGIYDALEKVLKSNTGGK
ncbi:MAG: hypothetical protein HQK65_15895 [Desulfamplus sp.]|nr:hypothetical protein [Desulfamplus sp.]